MTAHFLPAETFTPLYNKKLCVCVKKQKVDWKGYQSTHRDNNSEN